MTLQTIAAWLVSVPVTAITSVFLCEIAMGLAKPRVLARPQGGISAPLTVILIPAHDEEAGVAAMLGRLFAATGSEMRVLLVADNCTDRTAQIAKDAGAEVIERHDPARRGKGFALAFGRDHLRKNPPRCVVVLDADCDAGSDDLARLAIAAVASGRPVQANYLFRPDRNAPPLVQVSNFALAVKNEIRQLGLKRLGAPALLTGTGMAFPWAIFAASPLATDNLVEDLALGIDLLEAGSAPIFLAEATVWSVASSAAGTLGQRGRWEGGFVAMARQHSVPLLWRGLRLLSWQRMWMGFHLMVPPLALLVLINLAATTAIALLVWAGSRPGPLILMATVGAALVGSVAAAWLRVGRPYLSLAAAARLPLYLIWKIPIYLKLLRGGEKQWVRTDRGP